ncbi:hypothetical protein [Methanoculleus chikugoensis]|uniref:hypothetical protein n=1 Tax=Methanoculleus chikugoensis TaxID=118126 RepID=UPI001FB2B4D7|nr:hypothetical protein [Methanoculleus chikugoensis]
MRREILGMFLYEAMILGGVIGSVVGGVLSTAFGYLISVAAIEVATAGTTFGENFTVFDQSAVGFIVFGMAFGIGTSIAAGFYPPAWRASHLAPPVDAMRQK